ENPRRADRTLWRGAARLGAGPHELPRLSELRLRRHDHASRDLAGEHRSHGNIHVGHRSRRRERRSARRTRERHPAIPGPGRLRLAGRRGSDGIVPGGLCRPRSRMDRPLARHAPHAARQRRSADPRLLAPMARRSPRAARAEERRRSRAAARELALSAFEVPAELQHRVERFLYHEAMLLDEWRLEEWLALYTDDAR